MKLPRGLSGSEVAGLLARHYGYRATRTKGSHMTVTLKMGAAATMRPSPGIAPCA